MPIVDPQLARERARTGDLDGAIDMARSSVEEDLKTGEVLWLWLAAATVEPGYVLNELTLLRLRGLLARAHGDADADADDQFMAIPRQSGGGRI